MYDPLYEALSLHRRRGAIDTWGLAGDKNPGVEMT